MRSSLHWKDGAHLMSQIDICIVQLHINPDPNSTLKANADIKLSLQGQPFFFLSGVKLIQKQTRKLAVKMPSIRQGKGYHTLCYFLRNDLDHTLERQIITAYNQTLIKEKSNL